MYVIWRNMKENYSTTLIKDSLNTPQKGLHEKVLGSSPLY